MNKNIKTVALAAALMVALPAMAAEADTFCELNQAQADVQRSIAGSAEAFTTLGDPVTGSSSVTTVGVRKSLSKHYQAKLMGNLADAQCAAYSIDNRLAEQTSNVEQRGALQAINAMEPLLKLALAEANANVLKEQNMLGARASRLADVKAAFEQADRLRTDLAALAQQRSRLLDQLPAVDASLDDLVGDSVKARANVAALSSKITAQSGWDVSVSAGMRTDLRGNGQRENFVAVTASYSLGKGAADRAAGKVAALTEQLLTEQRDSNVQGLKRAQNTVTGLIAGETLALSGLEQRKSLTESSMARLAGLNTDDGLRTQRMLKVELLTVNAQLAASRARLQHLQGWLTRNGGKA